MTLLLELNSTFAGILGVPETFADLETSEPLCIKLIIKAKKINNPE